MGEKMGTRWDCDGISLLDGKGGARVGATEGGSCGVVEGGLEGVVGGGETGNGMTGVTVSCAAMMVERQWSFSSSGRSATCSSDSSSKTNWKELSPKSLTHRLELRSGSEYSLVPMVVNSSTNTTWYWGVMAPVPGW